MEKQHHIDAKELFQRFLQGDLNKAEEALLRKESETDPFLAEAIAGIDGGGAEDHTANLVDLRKQLAISKKDKKRTIFPWRILGAVAAVGCLLVIGSQLWQNNMPNAAMGDQLKKEAPASIENNSNIKVNSSEEQLMSVDKPQMVEKAEDNPQSVIQEIKKEPEFRYFSSDTEVKLRKQEPNSPTVVIDGVPIKRENPVSGNNASVNTPAPSAVEISKDKNTNGSEAMVVEEEAEESTEDIESQPTIAGLAEPSKKRLEQAPESKKESLADNQDSAYYTDSGLLIETEFDKNDSSFIYTGNVFDTEGAPLIGANILVEGTDYATTTDFNGGFVVASPKRLPTLEVFYLGYEPSRIRPYRNDDNLSIFLAADNTSLDEVVVTSNKRNESAARTAPLSKSASYQPKGGYAKWEKYLKKYLKKPKAAKSNKVSGKVRLSFTINDSGLVSNIEIIQSLGHGCDEEAIRLLKEGPKWLTNNRNVETLGEVIITF